MKTFVLAIAVILFSQSTSAAAHRTQSREGDLTQTGMTPDADRKSNYVVSNGGTQTAQEKSHRSSKPIPAESFREKNGAVSENAAQFQIYDASSILRRDRD